MSRRLRTFHLAWFAAAAGVITVWLYRSFIFSPDLMLWGQEMIDQSWQLREFGVEEVKAGRGVPLWNPYVFGGVPYVAILPGPVFYPTTLLYFLMPLFRAIGWTFVLHTWLAGLFAYFAARSLDLDRWSSSVTGLAFMLTGIVVSMNEAGHDGRMFTMVLIPLAFGCLEYGLRTGRLAWFLGMGLTVAAQIFTPHVQVMYFSSLVLSAYAAVRLAWLWREDRTIALRRAGGFVLGFAAAGVVGLAQLFPTLALTQIAVRGSGEGGYAFASSWALPPQELTALVLPDLVGSLQTYWGSAPFKQHTEYLGAGVAALALVGLTGFRRDRRIALIGGLALLCVLYALGSATPVHRIAYEVVPMIRSFRAASLMMGPAALLFALLAGFGWQRVLDTRGTGDATGNPTAAASAIGPLPWGWILGLSVPVVLLGLAAALSPDGLTRWVHTSWFPVGWPRRPSAEAIATLRVGGWLLVGVWLGTLGLAYAVSSGRWAAHAGRVSLAVLALIALDLARVGDRYIRAVDPSVAFAADPLIQSLQEEIDPVARVFPLEGYGPNELMLHDVRSVTGMQNFRLEWTERLMGGLGYANLASPAVWPLFDLDYILASGAADTPLLERIEAPAGSSVAAYRVVDDGPHAWFPNRVEAESDSSLALRLLLSRPDPVEYAIVATDGPAPPAGRGSARVSVFSPNEVVLDVEAAEEGLLVISEIYHPDWRAEVDGSEVELWRTDIALRGVVIPAGRHQVRLRMSAASVSTGLWIGGLALLACLAVIGREILLYRRPSEEPETEAA